MDKMIMISDNEFKIISTEGELIDHIITDDKSLVDFYKEIYGYKEEKKSYEKKKFERRK